ncbi:MAG: phosphoribosylglycinamide formyltransferase [Bacteroidales bacterium]|nr:phosphoribosylglycinamide formyltransferase [Bacteroidales bacterium]MDY6347643.1 phosphoribosylglycinamide formyltransferase [Bacteroidales bacterium]
MKRIAVFASGFGSNFQAIIDAVQNKTLYADIALLVSDKPTCKAVERAQVANIDVFTFSAKDFTDKAEYEAAVLNELQKRNVDYIVLAGYMKIVGNTLLQAFPMKIINLHPALLPSFPGAHGIADAYNYGVKVFGITIHFVDEGVDTGKIIDQFSFHAEENDTLDSIETKIHQLEHKYFPMTIGKVINHPSFVS